MKQTPNQLFEQLSKEFSPKKDKELSKNLNHGEELVGDVTQEIKLQPKMIKETGWADFLALNESKWIFSEIGKKITKFNIIDRWLVRQIQNEYNQTHWHNGHISGAGFLKVPKTFCNFSQEEQKKGKQKERQGRGKKSAGRERERNNLQRNPQTNPKEQKGRT